jgi:hypothetical protein
MAERHNPQEKEPEQEKISTDEASGRRKGAKVPPSATVQSWSVQLAARKFASLSYRKTPPPAQPSPPEPPKHVPVVPRGDYQPDHNDSPPVSFGQTDDEAARTERDEAGDKDTDQQPPN